MKNILFLVAGAALMFSSCAKDSETTPAPTPEKIALSFGNVISVEGAETRASAGYTDYTAPFRMNLAAVPDAYDAINGRQFSLISMVWTPESNNNVYVSPVVTTVTAWSPATIAPTDVNADPNVFTLTPAVYASTNDLVFAKNISVSSTSATINPLQLKHAYTKLTVKFEATSSYPGAKKFSALTLGNLYDNTSTIDIKDASVTVGALTTLDISSGLVSSMFPAAGIEVLVVPATEVPTITCTLDGKAFGPLTPTGISSLEMGKNYVLTLTATGTGINISNVEIEDWVDGGNATVPIQ